MNTALAFGAHPDDIEFGCGGTERKLIENGWRVVHVYVTSGEGGSIEEEPHKLELIREEEARQSARVLGVSEVHFLKLPDGLRVVNEKAILAMIEIIRREKPQIIFNHASTDKFSDHKTVSEAVAHAIKVASGPWFAGSGHYKPWRVNQVYGYEVWDPIPQHGTAVDISNTIDRKVQALRKHVSQLESIDYDQACLGLAAYRGVMSGLGGFAEVFEVVNGRLTLEDL